ncbi:MAG TPA: hypothetical protein VGA65_03790 [Hyphomicrobium sp.]|jgi:hypothetical protein
MPFSDASYDPQTLGLLMKAFDKAWHEVQSLNPGCTASQLSTTRKMMALRIMDAANKGERDPERLKDMAVRAVDGRDFG